VREGDALTVDKAPHAADTWARRANDRTLMARVWMAFSMVSFGFTLFKFFQTSFRGAAFRIGPLGTDP
jgi:uncharacterized membrane protein YidH (DUF202 family)